MNAKDEIVFPQGSGPRWALTPKGRRAARRLAVAAVVGLVALGCTCGIVLTLIVIR